MLYWTTAARLGRVRRRIESGSLWGHVGCNEAWQWSRMLNLALWPKAFPLQYDSELIFVIAPLSLVAFFESVRETCSDDSQCCKVGRSTCSKNPES